MEAMVWSSERSFEDETPKQTSYVKCGGWKMGSVVALSTVLFAFCGMQEVSAFSSPAYRPPRGQIGNISPRVQLDRRTTGLRVSSLEKEASSEASSTDLDIATILQDDGLYHCKDEEQHKAFLKNTEDKLVVLKVYAPWCRACKGLEPKFKQVSKDPNLNGVPIVFSALSIQDNKDYVKRIGVLALPTVQFYLHGKKIDNFPCGPSKVPILKRKLTKFVKDNIDVTTNTVKIARDIITELDTTVEALPEKEKTETSNKGRLTMREMSMLRNTPYLKELEDEEFASILEKSRVLTFESGSVIMREGNIGKSFYVILGGEIEICQKTAFEDPLTTPSSYLGTVINRLSTNDYFGERGLMTGEPRAASIRVTEPLRVVSILQEDFPLRSILSGVRRNDDASAVVDLDDKYGVPMRDLNNLEVQKQVRESSFANQVRGSVLTPELIPGVDDDQEIEIDETLPEQPKMPTETPEKTLFRIGVEDETIIPLLQKFRLVRLVSRCFGYITMFNAQWGSPGLRNRRSMLVARLSETQRLEFQEAFHLVDVSGDGSISVSELKNVMNTVGEPKSENDLLGMIPTGSQSMDGEQGITMEDFMGIMAEAEFYYLFIDIFSSLDKEGSGFVRASELNRVLCGVRDMISGDKNSIIDVEDKDMMIDYEQFAKMLLGTQL